MDNAQLLKKYIHPMLPVPTGISPELGNLRRYAAILFDVYGTLLISRAGDIGFDRADSTQAETLEDLLRRYGIRSTPQRLAIDLHKAIVSSHAKSRDRGIAFPEVDIVWIWKDVLGLPSMTKCADFALEYEMIVNPVYPMNGMVDLLTSCRDEGVPIGIVSNAQFYTVCLLEYFLGDSLSNLGFDKRLLFFSWQTHHAKPSPSMYRQAKKALLSMGIPDVDTLYVGNDMQNDIIPAASVGFNTALFAGDRRSLRLRKSDDRCRNRQPDLIVTDLRQLIVGL